MCDAPIGTTRWSPAKMEMVSKKLMYSGVRGGISTLFFYDLKEKNHRFSECFDLHFLNNEFAENYFWSVVFCD